MSNVPSARSVLRYVRNHPGKTARQLAKALFHDDVPSAMAGLKSLDEYLRTEDSRAHEFRDTNQAIIGERIHFITPKGIDYLRDHFSVEAKFWISVILSIIALVIAVYTGIVSPTISVPAA